MSDLIPKLRFTKFNDNWNSNFIENLCTVSTGNKDTQNKVDDGEFPFFVRSDKVERINTYSYDGEAVLTSGDGVGVGKNFHYINSTFDYHQRVYCMFDFNEINGKYFYYNFSTNFNRRVMKMSAKNSVDSVRRDMITKMVLTYPSLEEQTKIAEFLTSVDKQIELLETKKSKLNTYKSGLMQKLFSQELRFKDDNGNDYPEWKNSYFENEVNIIGGGTPDTTNDKFWNGEINWFTPSEIKIKYINQSYRTITEEGLKSSSAKILPIGTILLTTRATIGYCSILEQIATTNQGFQSIVVNKNNFNEFFYYWIINNRNEFIKRATGSTFLEISKKEILKIPIRIPSLIEQNKIANFLTSIDQQIDTVDQQIKKTQSFKKGLLQQMFV